MRRRCFRCLWVGSDRQLFRFVKSRAAPIRNQYIQLAVRDVGTSDAARAALPACCVSRLVPLVAVGGPSSGWRSVLLSRSVHCFCPLPFSPWSSFSFCRFAMRCIERLRTRSPGRHFLRRPFPHPSRQPQYRASGQDAAEPVDRRTALPAPRCRSVLHSVEPHGITCAF